MHCSCIAFRRIVAKRLPPLLSTGRRASFGMRPKTGCIPKKHSWNIWFWVKCSPYSALPRARRKRKNAFHAAAVEGRVGQLHRNSNGARKTVPVSTSELTFEGANMIRLSISSIALVLSLAVPGALFGADDDVSWITDKNGCKVANPFPQPGETITWDGKCKNGVADGEGLLQWYISGKLADRYEGSLQEGWAEGKGTLTRTEGGRYSG